MFQMLCNKLSVLKRCITVILFIEKLKEQSDDREDHQAKWYVYSVKHNKFVIGRKRQTLREIESIAQDWDQY